ncbi:MAG: hypothetical protein ACTHNP_12165 [Solirubrobacterales bacterium]
MKGLKGPQLKLAELKVPDVLKDLYWDLRDRRLLPLIGLLLVAIVAVPFLLGSGGKKPEPVTPSLAGGEGAKEAASLTAVPAEPGLREPSKRLAGLPAKNPFRQHFTSPVFNKGAAPLPEGSGGGGGGTSPEVVEGGSSSGGGSAPPSEPAPVPTEPSGESGGSGSGPIAPGETRLLTFHIEIKVAHTEVTKSGSQKMGEPETMEDVKAPTALPGAKAPVLTYLGADFINEKALMLVSTEATALFGDNKCVAGRSTCQLLELEKGMPEVVEFGENHARYKFELLKIVAVKGPRIKPQAG